VPDPTEEELEQEEREFQNSPAGHFFGTVSGVYFELKDLHYERELTDAVLETVDALADDLKEAVEQARKHPVGIWLDWKHLSEEGLETINRGLEHYGLKFSAAEDTGDAWVLKLEEIYKRYEGADGHSYVDSDDGKPHRVDEIVCTTFNGPAEPGQVVRHKDGDIKNNRADNLEWVWQQEPKGTIQ
jgi:hypothetical protein